MKNENPKKPMHYTSASIIRGTGIRITVEISSRHNKAYRRNFLNAFNKAVYREMKFMRSHCIVHDDTSDLNYTRDFLRNWSLKQGIPVDKTRTQLGFLIREKRTSLGLNQETFAKLLQIERTYVSKLEHGFANPSLALMKKIHELQSLSPKPISALNDALNYH
jgi:DNA-binding XRE family transcriptional regulator